MNLKSTEVFQGSENILCDIMMGICHTFFQPHRMYNTTSEPHGLWAIMMCEYRFILGKKCTVLMSDAGNGETMHMCGQGR